MGREEINELAFDPVFNYGDKVRSKKNVRNDGTFPGREVGDILVKKGDIGYVNSIGTFLQQFYIYAVDFYEHGYMVGMRGKELDLLEDVEDFEDVSSSELPSSNPPAESAVQSAPPAALAGAEHPEKEHSEEV